MSENGDIHCTGATEVEVTSQKGMPEEKSLQESSENRRRGCGRDVLRQTVPRVSGSICNREGPITDCGQPVNGEEEVERNRLRASKSAGCCKVSTSCVRS